MSKILLSIVGPTAIGKTAKAITLAQYYKTSIISADSRQFYKEMRIGTAVPSPVELATIEHHFIQHISISESYSVGAFERDAIKLLGKLFKVHDVVIMVGGSGLYTDAVTSGLDTFPEVDPEIRAKLNKRLLNEGISALQQELKQLDSHYYEKVDLDNSRRLIRALEICYASNKPYSTFLNQPKVKRPFKTITLGLQAERKIIYDRINARVNDMMDSGLLREAEGLYQHKENNALQTVGYRELFQYLDKKTTLVSAIAEIKKNTRRFAKRQLTWSRKKTNVVWVSYDVSSSDLIAKVEEVINANTKL